VSFAIGSVFNFARNVFLVVVAQHSGMAALERWHDRAGWAMLALALPLLWFLGRRWRGSNPAVTAGRWVSPLPFATAALLSAWFCVSLVGVEVWYRIHQPAAGDIHRLEVRWPAPKSGAKIAPLDDRSRDQLLCATGQSALWSDPRGNEWVMTVIGWEPGRTSAQSARLHRPEVCYEATGAKYLGKNSPELIEVPGGVIRFEPMAFQRDARTVYLFYALYEERNSDAPTDYLQTWTARLQHALRGQRNLGQHAIELSSASFGDYPSALAAAREQLPALLSLTRHPAE
jgi:hypothetical protein